MGAELGQGSSTKASGCCQVWGDSQSMGASKCPPASFGGSEPFGARTFLLQLAGPTCSPVNRWAGTVLQGAGRGSSSPISALWAELKRGTDRLEDLTPPIRHPARALAPYSPTPSPRMAFKRGGLLGLPYFSALVRSGRWPHSSRVFTGERLQSWKETSRSACGRGEPADG